MSPAARIERLLCPGLPEVRPGSFDAPRTRARLRDWSRRHRLLVTSGLLDGLSLPFNPCLGLDGSPALPSNACYEEWHEALRAELDRPVPDRARIGEILSEGESALAALRAFERSDLALMHERRLRLVSTAGIGVIATVVCSLALFMTVGEVPAAAVWPAWLLLALACAWANHRIVAPRIAA